MLKKILCPILIVLGIGAFIFGIYISGQVRIGEKKIHNAQKGVNQVCNLAKGNSYTKLVGKVATSPIQKKINEGKGTVQGYKKLASWLKISGIVLFSVGFIWLLFVPSKKKNK